MDYDEESDLLDENDIMINYSDMDQSMKGEDINHVGNIKALDKKKREELALMAYEENEKKAKK